MLSASIVLPSSRMPEARLNTTSTPYMTIEYGSNPFHRPVIDLSFTRSALSTASLAPCSDTAHGYRRHMEEIPLTHPESVVIRKSIVLMAIVHEPAQGTCIRFHTFQEATVQW